MQQSAKYCRKRCNDVARGMVRAEPLPATLCVVCGQAFTPRDPGGCYCSAACRANRPRQRVRVYRTQPYTDQLRDKDQRKRARRRGAATGRPVLRDVIARRDKWTCGICQRAVDPAVKYPDPMSPSLDHVVPLSHLGDHDPANVRLTHLRCNVVRSNRGGGEQLALFG